MKILRGLIDVIGFLTIIPVKLNEQSLKNTAEHMYLFPVIGALIGFIGGVTVYLVSKVFPSIIAATISLFTIFVLTRFYHIDGLLDFGDGLMVHGSQKEKLNAMKDVRIGTGGLVLGLMIILLTIITISKFSQHLVVQCFITSEVLAKLSMVVLAVAGKSAKEGINRYFIETMKGWRGTIRFLLTIIITLTICLPLLGLNVFYAITTTVFTCLSMLIVSNINFGGVTGDVFGAVNETSRVTSLLTLLMVTSC